MLVELYNNLLSSGDFNRDGIDQLGIMLGPCMHDDERLKWVHFTSNIQRNKQTNKWNCCSTTFQLGVSSKGYRQ
jgi:hypothetical protein